LDKIADCLVAFSVTLPMKLTKKNFWRRKFFFFLNFEIFFVYVMEESFKSKKQIGKKWLPGRRVVLKKNVMFLGSF
jgi:hypothetical protein